MQIAPNEITKKMLEKAMQCETAEGLIALAKTKDIDITKKGAEAYLEELSEHELEDGELKYVAEGNLTVLNSPLVYHFLINYTL